MRFACIDDGVPSETISLLRTACDERGAEFVHLDARRFEFDLDAALEPGDALYCPAVSVAAQRVEQFLATAWVASFHSHWTGAFFNPSAPPLIFQQLGLPTPRTLPLVSADRDGLLTAVQRLGGFPVVVKLPGGSNGVGVLRADSPAALFSLADLLLAEGRNPFLSAYVAPAIHWRVVVVGGRAVAAYRNPTQPNDFRSTASEAVEDYTANPPAELGQLALRAAEVLQTEFAGVDILEHDSGRLYLLEANFPCYFAQAQLAAGIDVAGAMIDHLKAKAARLAASD